MVAKKSVEDISQRFSTDLHLVWGSVALTGIAAAYIVWEWREIAR